MERGQVYQRRVPVFKYEQPELTSERFNQKNVSVFVDEKRNEKTFSGPCPVEITRPEYLETATPFTNRNMWTWETDLEDLTPEEIKVKVNPVYNTLTLTGERQVIHRRGCRVEDECKPTNVFKRVVSLPENVDVNQFKTFMTEEGKLILTAPYMTMRGAETKECNIPITFGEDNTSLEKMTLNEMNTMTNLPMSHYLRLLKTNSFPGTLGAECVKDEITGEWKLMIELDTVGFRPEEIRVKFDDEERCLIVKAKREVVGLANNVFQHELVIPEYIKENELKWRILNNGVLRIEMPCERETIRQKGINKVFRY